MTARVFAALVVSLAACLSLPALAGAAVPGANGRIVFATTPDNASSSELYSVAPDGSGLTRLTWSFTTEQYPAWSPDGSRIAFQSFAEGRPSIHVMNADGSDEQRVSPSGFESDDMEPTWSPDGTEIAFASTRPWNETWQIWVMGADGSNPRRLTSEFSTAPAWSPDGAEVAYLRADGSIAVVGREGGAARSVTTPPLGHVDERPSWSPDGTKLVFARRETFGSSPKLFVVDRDGSNERQLTEGGASRFPAWSPDGTRIAFTRDRQLYVIAPDGSGMQPLLPASLEALTPDWGTSTAVPDPQVPGAPRIQIFSPEAQVYPAGAEVRAFYLCESDTSFVVSCEGDVPLGELVDTDTTGPRTFTVRATDADGRTSTATVSFEVLDWRAPMLHVATPADGGEYDVGQLVHASYECVDEPGGSGVEICDGELQRGQPLDTSRTGSFTVHFWALDRAHNFTEVTVTYHVVERDRTPPTITIETPSDGAVFVLGEPASASYDCTDEPGGSGLDVCHAAPLDTSSVGTRSFTVKARDRAGNTSTATRTYRVVYAFGGFLPPLVPAPGFASMDAGETVPVKFSLAGDHGAGVVPEGSPTWTPLDCVSGLPAGAPSPARRTLAYLAGSGRYQLLVQTDVVWRGGCRELAVTLDDGTRHVAVIRFG